MDEFHEKVYTVQKEPEDNRRLNDGREEKQNFKRTDSNICILYSFWTVSGIDACRNGECSVQGGIWLVLIGAGVYHILIFVLEKDNSTILDLFSGVIVLVIGIFLFMNPTVVVKLLTLMLGAFILVDSIWMMRGSMKLKKRGQGVWKAFLVESLIFIGLGVLILVNPFSEIRMTVQISGCIFVANGVLDIIFYLILKHGLKKEIQDGSAGDGK